MKCYYCDHELIDRSDYELDHFPVPQRHGGTLTVYACQACHELKDRTLFIDWPQSLIDDALAHGRSFRLYLAKMHAIVLDMEQELETIRAARGLSDSSPRRAPRMPSSRSMSTAKEAIAARIKARKR